MKNDNWNRIKEIVDEAIRREPEKRLAFLNEACGDNDSIRREVESLLSSFERADGFMEAPVIEAVTEEIQTLNGGQVLGRYEVLRRLGEGGMGIVYLGRDTVLDRLVAVKVLNKRYERHEDNLRRFVREAKAASALNHPNILTIFEIGEFEGSHFIVSEYIEGRTLREIMKSEKLELGVVVDVVRQIANALAAAHKARIVHRDLKPENVIVREDGYVKVLDFGLAKLLPENASSILTRELTIRKNTTASGMVLGTVNYMSPEQAKGEKVDERTDIFSLGVVLYEMIAGRRPFEGNSTPESFANLINKQPEPLEAHASGVPAELEMIVSKMLQKDRSDRYQSMQDLIADLRELRFGHRFGAVFEPRAASGSSNVTATLPQTTGDGAHATAQTSAIYTAWHKRWRIEAAIVMLLAVGAGGYWLWHRSNQNWARSQVSRIDELAKAGKNFEAFDLASSVQDYLPGDPDLIALMPTISDTLTVNSEPAGAKVYLKRYQPDDGGAFPERQLIGTTPISGLRIPRGPQIVYLEKEGYAPVQIPTSTRVLKFAYNMTFTLPPIEISRRLIEAGAIPDKMVFVPGGDYRLASSSRPTDDKITLDDYFIDKYEVSNKDYREFVSAGGYARQEYWKVPVVKDGRTLSWNEAMSLFHDRTSLPGPREWSNQDFPTGENHPVTGITWYEAAAYAEFRGKKLPTVFQWEKAARNGAHIDAGFKMPWGDLFAGDPLKYRANFDNSGTVPVDSGEFGISEFGAFNMAGNVSEWVLNEGSDGYFATGGAWGEPVYTFSYFGVYPGLFESPKRGFRCVRLAATDQAGGDQGAAKLQKDRNVETYHRTTEAEFREIARVYDYAKTPLEPEVVETIETADWRREKITFNGAAGKRAIAYLYLPHNAARPLQVVQYVAGSDVETGLTAVPLSAEGWVGSVIRSGRALLAVVTEGNLERPWPADFKRPPYDSVEWQDLLVNRFTDYRRGLDYLETRGDIDMSRVGYVGLSSGASQGMILPAVEPRIRSVFLAAAGLTGYYKTNQPAANPINFAPHLLQPKHVLNGRFDENFPIKSAVEPMMKLLPEPKELELYDGPHAAPMEVLVPALNKFFDKTLGPVGRQ
jgi:formylglycine-generating enzyme required for sulfatase activity/tRNA A-37 threonylcarbamoyl transferase component Bud32